ncbi:NRDE family protein [Leucobacter sp. PH1c]|uniref:NRDE family protein n=1 Tax=Leucobacter sp. PH1c TaxID=1397278 RepID=UPI0004691D66|nr:NRDE family protein [Leucobacter sp. PH1c]
MCTVVIEVPTEARDAIRILAVRDEDPARAWDPPGPWWPERFPGVIGVRDRRAGGAWLAAQPASGRLAVLLNRAAEVPEPAAGFRSRGELPLAAVEGGAPSDPPGTPAFTLVSLGPDGAETVSWDGSALRRQRLAPGVHMVDHREVDDPASPRIARWLPVFRAAAGAPAEGWRARWLRILAESAALGPEDERAIVRDNTPHGYPTQSLLVCTAEAGGVTAPGPPRVSLHWAALARPGRWDDPAFTRALPAPGGP